jgi:hypothetical protein
MVMDVTNAIGLKHCAGCDGFYEEKSTVFELDKYDREICEGCSDIAVMKAAQAHSITSVNRAVFNPFNIQFTADPADAVDDAQLRANHTASVADMINKSVFTRVKS